MPTQPDSLHARLAKAQFEFLRAADAVNAAGWKTRPGTDKWSAAEVVAHLMMIERAVIEKADRVTQQTPRPIPFFRKFHLPLALVEMRVVKRKSPVPLDTGLLSEKESMLADLRTVRERTLAFLEEARSRNLSGYYWPHPFLGMFSLSDWIDFLAAHQNRHAKQIREIAASLPKNGETLQK